jgi:translation initiation factor IF-2
MAKKKPTSRTDAVRQAVDQAFQTQIPRERIGELLDELGHTAGRLRGAVDELRPASAEEVKTLRADLEALAARVEALEAAAAAAAEAKTKSKPRSRAAAKPAARAGTAKTSATGAKPAAKPRKRAAAKPKPSAEGS